MVYSDKAVLYPTASIRSWLEGEFQHLMANGAFSHPHVGVLTPPCTSVLW